MTLIEESMESCAIMQKVRIPDGEGGFTTQWTEGAGFRASITFDNSIQARTVYRNHSKERQSGIP